MPGTSTMRWRCLALAACWASAAVALGARAEEAIVPAPEAPAAPLASLEIGYASVSEPHFLLKDFETANPAIHLLPTAWPRQVDLPFRTPLPLSRSKLPALISVFARNQADDVRQLSAQGLIEPAEAVLAELGMTREDFLPGVIDAFTVRGTLWAIPYHASVPVLRYNRAAFGDAGPPEIGSWEELIAAAKKSLAPRGQPGPRRMLGAPYSVARFAEIVALSAGAPPMNLADPVFLTSPEFAKALQFAVAEKAKGTILFRQQYTALEPSADYAFGLDYVDDVYPTAFYGVMPFPRRVLAADTPGASFRVPASVEGFALRAHSPVQRASALAFLKWIYSPASEWHTFEATNTEDPAKKWLLDNLHVPLRRTVLASIDFDYAMRKFPGLPALKTQMESAWYPSPVPALDAQAWELVEALADYAKPDEDLAPALAEIASRVRGMVRNAAVETAAYEGY